MFGKKYKEAQAKGPLPKWALWLIFFGIGYLVVIGNLSHVTPATPTPYEEATAARNADKTASQSLMPTGDFPAIRRTLNISNWQRAFNPSLAKGLVIKDSLPGKGRAMACGDSVTLWFDAKDSSGKMISNELDTEHDIDKSVSFVIGARSVFPALEQGVVGMRIGGNRIIDAPPALVFEDMNIARGLSNVVLYVNLLTVSPAMEADALPLQVSPRIAMDDGKLVCGETLHADMKIWDESGKLMKERANVALKLGDTTTPLGLNHALVGIEKGAKRVITLPPYHQTHEGKGWSQMSGKSVRVVEVTRIK